jgi:protein SCO1/2
VSQPIAEDLNMNPRLSTQPPVRHVLLGAMLTAWALLTVGASGPVAAHGNHAAHPAAAGQQRSEHAYSVPAIKVTRADGKRMRLVDAIDDGRPVLLNFIYTSCNAICPVTSQVFVEVREKLGAERDKVNMVSISIDADQDTPATLTAYARRYGSAGVWAHYTGTSADMVDLQRAFDAWRGDKMNHQPTTYLRAAPGQPWVRLDGFYGPTALIAEFQKTVPAQAAPARCNDAAPQQTRPTPATAGTPAELTTKCKS